MIWSFNRADLSRSHIHTYAEAHATAVYCTAAAPAATSASILVQRYLRDPTEERIQREREVKNSTAEEEEEENT